MGGAGGTAETATGRSAPPLVSDATMRLYASDWAHFAAWCRAGGHTALPTTPAIMAAYLTQHAALASRGTLSRRRSAIAATHRAHALPVPTLDRAHRASLKLAVPPAAARPPRIVTAEHLQTMAQRAPRDLAGLRDRALLLLAASLCANSQAAVPRSFLIRLDAEHVRLTHTGAELRLFAHSSEEAPSRTIALTRDAAATRCPVRALENWLRASDTAYGPVFRKVDRWGNVEHARLGHDAWSRILRRHAR